MRPASLPPQTTDDPNVPPTDGGPWTDLHAGVFDGLSARLKGAQDRERQRLRLEAMLEHVQLCTRDFATCSECRSIDREARA